MMHVTFRDPELEASPVGAASEGSWTTRKRQTRLSSTTLVRNSQVLGGSLSKTHKTLQLIKVKLFYLFPWLAGITSTSSCWHFGNNFCRASSWCWDGEITSFFSPQICWVLNLVNETRFPGCVVCVANLPQWSGSWLIVSRLGVLFHFCDGRFKGVKRCNLERSSI